MANVKFRDIAHFTLRIPPELKVRLEEIAKSKLKGSLNAEILDRLEKSLGPKCELKDYTDGELIDELIRRWGRDSVLIRLGREESP